MVDERLLKLREKIKAKKPTFLRQEADKISKLRKTWRQPKGSDSKMRKKFRGNRKQPSMGYSSPRKVRGLHKSGLQEVRVETVSALEGIDPATQIVVVAKVGNKKKVEILKACESKKLKIANVKDTSAFMTKVSEGLARRQKKRKARKAKKVVSKEAPKKEKKSEEKKDNSSPETKKGEKSDKIKTLEKRQ
jgi:large subunit ribosomal protein L32e